jgi:hypothetical protein
MKKLIIALYNRGQRKTYGEWMLWEGFGGLITTSHLTKFSWLTDFCVVILSPRYKFFKSLWYGMIR